MCNRILLFINKKRSYYVDWVSSREPGLGRCNLAKKERVSLSVQPEQRASLCVFLVSNEVETIQRVSVCIQPRLYIEQKL